MTNFRVLKRGACYDILIATDHNGHAQVWEYVRSLDPETHKRMRKIITNTADVGKYTFEETYRHIGEQIYEFKARTARVYSFNDGRLIVLTHGGDKPKSVAADRAKAVRVRDDYLTAKGQNK